MVEDAHWADDMSMRLLAFVARRGERWPLLLVTTAREEELVDAPTVRRTIRELMQPGHANALTLPPLTRQDIAVLTRSLAPIGRDADTLVTLEDSVWRLSEGNPFVAIETIRMIEDTSSPGATVGVAVPQRVHELITGRLERLSEPARQLARVAAVIGEEFEFTLLQRAADLDDEATAAGVEELVRRRIVRGAGERLDFVHEWIRSAVYRELLPHHRRSLHRRVGDALEVYYADHPETRHVTLGIHFLEGEVWKKAVAYFRHAGIAASARSASREAVACFERALKALSNRPDDPDSPRSAVDLRLDLQSGYLLLGELTRMDQCLREAEALAARLGDEPRRARVWCHLSACAWWTGALATGVDYAGRALTSARKMGDVPLQILARARLSLAHTAAGEYPAAIEIIEENIGALTNDLVAQRFGMASMPAVTDRSYLGVCRASLGDFRGAAAADEAIEIATAADHPYSIAMAQFGAGRWRALQGDFHQAIPWLERALEACRRQQFYAFSVIGGWVGLAYAHCGRAAEGVALLEESLAREQAASFMPDRARTLTFLGEAYLLAGRSEDALRAGHQALSVTRVTRQPQFEAMALRLLGDVHLHRDPLVPEAERDFSEALVLAEARGLQPVVARCHLGLGMLHRSIGNRSEAQRDLSTARDLLRSMEMALWLEQADTELAAL
jgi:tetratricopeptide (TPR) repeat protein